VNRIIKMLIELCKCQWKTRESQDQKGRLWVGYCVGKPGKADKVKPRPGKADKAAKVKL
jgi:hypothetical protein